MNKKLQLDNQKSQITNSNEQQYVQHTSRKQKIYEYGIFIWSAVYHYIDCWSDYYVIYFQYQLATTDEYGADSKLAAQQILGLAFIVLSIERENLILASIANDQVVFMIMAEIDLDFMVIFSIITSTLSIISVSYKSYISKIQNSLIFKKKQDIQFQELSPDCQIYVTNPFSFGFIKQNSPNIYKFPELFNESEQINKSSIINNSMSVVSIKKQIQQQTVQVGFVTHVWLMFYFFIYYFTMMILFSTSFLSSLVNYGYYLHVPSFIIFTPQILCFLYYSLKYSKSYTEKLKVLCKTIFGIPILAQIGVILYNWPYRTDRIPLVPKIIDTWNENFYNSSITILIKNGFLLLWFFSTYFFLYHDGLYMLPYLTDYLGTLLNSRLFMLSFQFSAAGTVFITFFNVVYMIERYREIQQSKNNNQMPWEQQLYQQQQLQQKIPKILDEQPIVKKSTIGIQTDDLNLCEKCSEKYDIKCQQIIKESKYMNNNTEQITQFSANQQFQENLQPKNEIQTPKSMSFNDYIEDKSMSFQNKIIDSQFNTNKNNKNYMYQSNQSQKLDLTNINNNCTQECVLTTRANEEQFLNLQNQNQ